PGGFAYITLEAVVSSDRWNVLRSHSRRSRRLACVDSHVNGTRRWRLSSVTRSIGPIPRLTTTSDGSASSLPQGASSPGRPTSANTTTTTSRSTLAIEAPGEIFVDTSALYAYLDRR